MALSNDQLTAAVNGAIQAVYPGISNGQEVALFAGSMQMMLLQGKRLTDEAEAALAKQGANEAVTAADAVAREAQERANAAAAEFLAFVAQLAQG
jgi:hypothetical protein